MKKLRHKSVLVIDDDAGMLRALNKVLACEGAVVTRAQWARDALVILHERERKIDLVITDLQMPFMTGVLTGMSIVQTVHEILPTLPIIVLTAFGGAEIKSKCLRLGAAAFLEKPVETSQLLASIEAVWPVETEAR
jgi:DNA-binding NtrC family response regulator